MKKRFWSMVLALALVLTMLPGAVFAADSGDTGTPSTGGGTTGETLNPGSGDGTGGGTGDSGTPTEIKSPQILNNVEYTLSADKTSWIVTASGSSLSGNVVIKEEINHLPVTIINPGVFSDKGITSIVLPSSIETIGANAFAGCEKLKTVTIQNKAVKGTDGSSTVVPIKQIGKSAFSGCTELTTFFGSVEEIGETAFEDCQKLNSVIVPAGLKKIDSNAFLMCKGLKEVFFAGPAAAADVAADVFDGATSLKVLHISKDFNKDAFRKLLDSIPLSNGVKATAHRANASVKTKTADCTENGYIRVHVACNGDCTFDKTNDLTIPKLGHILEKIPAKPATCVANGATEGTRCTRADCTYAVEPKVIPKTGHTWEEKEGSRNFTGKNTYKAPTCSEEGLGKATYVCKVCNTEETREDIAFPATGKHAYTKLTGDLSEKDEETWYTLKTADCTREDEAERPGLEVRAPICVTCGSAEELTKDDLEEILKDYSNYTTRAVEPVHESDGKIVRIETVDGSKFDCEKGGENLTVTYTCKKCEKEFEKTGAELKAGTHIPAEDPPAETDIPDALKKDIKAATCTEKGKEAFTCTVCGQVYLAETPALGHLDPRKLPESAPEPGASETPALETDVKEPEEDDNPFMPEEIITLAPHCETDGKKIIGRVFCARGCGAVLEEGKEEVIPKLGHTVKDTDTKRVEPTCTVPGSITKSGECQTCHKQVDEVEAIPPTGHTPSAGMTEKITKEATCTEEGTVEISTVCEVCGEPFQSGVFPIAASGHNFEEKTTGGVKEMVCTVCGAKQGEDETPADPGGDTKPGDGDENEDSGEKEDPEITVYSVNLIRTSNGSISASVSRAASGETVRVTATPYSGYELDYLRVTRKDGNTVSLSSQGGGQYTFTMPASWVDVYAVFVRTPSYYSSASNDRTPAPAPSQIVIPTIQTVPRATASGQIFADIPSSYWAAGEIAWAYQHGYMGGTGLGRFTPDGTITFQQMWMVLARITGSRPANMEQARRWALENGFAEGANPSTPITRQQLVTALYRTAVLLGRTPIVSGNLAGYTDSATVSAPARNAMTWAVSNGILSGTADSRLNPNGTTTRAQFAVILYRFSQRSF